MVNKRAYPDYYQVIKEPMALSKLKTKIANKEYKSLAEFVRDCALVSPRPRSQRAIQILTEHVDMS